MAKLEVSLLGPFLARLEGAPITGFESVKVRLLLAYLAVESASPQPRERLAGLLWPDWPQQSAMSNLRYALANLRKNIGDRQADPPFLLISRQTIRLNPDGHSWVDVVEFEQLTSSNLTSAISDQRVDFGIPQIDTTELKSKIELYRGEFLEGFSLNDCPDFEEWVLARRAHYQRLVLQALHALAEAHRQRGEFEPALVYARRQLELEPWQENAHQQVMLFLALSGQRSAALAQYETCQRLLAKELGVKPSVDTVRLYEAIRDENIAVEVRDSTQVPSPISHRITAAKEAGPTALPTKLTSFIGRQKEIAAVKRLLQDRRLVTLTGSGGTGKTRLSLQVAGELLEEYPNGAWLVELAPLADAALVPQAVASALHLVETPGKPLLDSLVDFLRHKRLLLVLDNCEHLLDACARLVDSLLGQCPNLTILASSREFLGVEGEVPYRVPPLDLPDPYRLPPLGELAGYDAIHLFTERARLIVPDFALSDQNAQAVAQVVTRLDGIPLAIELAASRLRILSVQGIASRIDDVYRLLTGGSRTALPRHQTLRALIDWSYDLLSKPERVLLRRLSVFAGSWSLAAAEQVCAGDLADSQPLCQEDILELLSGLVDKSLVMAKPAQHGEGRFMMLEIIRQYAHEKLVDEKEAAAARSRHLDYYLELAEALELKIRSRAQLQTLDRLEIELDNLRLALEWGLHGNQEPVLRIAAALKWFWHIRCHWTEAIDWLEQGLELANPDRSGETVLGNCAIFRAKALEALSFHLMMSSSAQPSAIEKAIQAAGESLSIYQACGEGDRLDIQQGQAWALLWLSSCLFSTGREPERAVALAQAAQSLFRQTGDAHGLAESLQLLGNRETDPARRMAMHQEQLEIDQANGDVEGIATALFHVGFTAFSDGAYDRASAAFEASREQYRRVNNPNMVAMTSLSIGNTLFARGDLQLAEQYLQESLAIYTEIGLHEWISFCLFFIGQLRIAQGRYDQAEEVSEKAWQLSQTTGSPAIAGDALYLRARLARVRGDWAAVQKNIDALLHDTQTIPRHQIFTHLELGYLALERGDMSQARSRWPQAIQILSRQRQMIALLWPMDAMAIHAAREGRLERAARIFGSRWCRAGFHFLSPEERAQRETALDSVRVALGEARFEQLFQEGQSMTLEQALALVE